MDTDWWKSAQFHLWHDNEYGYTMRVYDLLKNFFLNKLDLNEISIAFDFDGVICDSQWMLYCLEVFKKTIEGENQWLFKKI